MRFALPTLATLALAAPSVAFGHGAFPESTGLTFWPAGGQTPIVHTTFGSLVPEASGSWSWICEEILPQADLSTLARDAAGRWYVGGIFGLYTSADGCDWQIRDDAVSGLYVTQLSLDVADPSRVLLTTSTAGGDNRLWATDARGAFESVASFGPGSTLRGFIQGAGGAPFYVVGWLSGVAMVWVDRGQGWQAIEVQGHAGGAVRPLGLSAEGGIYLRADVTQQGEIAQTFRLLYLSPDGSFSQLIDLPGEITAFSAQPGLIEVGGRDVGLYTSTDGGATFDGPEVSPEVGCLTRQGGARFACANNFVDGGSVLRGEPGAQEVVQAFGNVHGVYSCPATSQVTTTCGPLWAEVKVSSGLDTAPQPTPTPTLDLPPEETGCGRRGDGQRAWLLAALPAFLRRRSRWSRTS